MAGREIDWPGKSGKKYHYWIYDLGTKHDPVPANYVFTKETEQGTFRPIYIGQTSDISERFDNHHKWLCIVKNGATHVCTHKSSVDEKARLAEEGDLIKNYNPVCND
ncbi:MAG: GIY-YIG nuclease family protein [Chloroflexi bacterium]|nr:GIY-YIG nuclease family protein [Chloroflexota bacterium]